MAQLRVGTEGLQGALVNIDVSPKRDIFVQRIKEKKKNFFAFLTSLFCYFFLTIVI